MHLVFTVTDGDGKPIQGATAVEKVVATKGKEVEQNEQTVALGDKGQGSDWVTNMVPDSPENPASDQSIGYLLYDRFVTKQEFTLTITLKSGSVVEVTQTRTLTNMNAEGTRRNAFDPRIGAPGVTYSQGPLQGRVVK